MPPWGLRFRKKRSSNPPGAIGGIRLRASGGVELSDRKGLPATDDGEYQYEIRSAVEGHKSGRDRKRVDALTADGVSAIVVRRSRRQPFRPAPPRQQAAPRIEPY